MMDTNTLQANMWNALIATIVILAIFATYYYVYRVPRPDKRFRKRDKVIFYSRRFLRKVSKSVKSVRKRRREIPTPKLEIIEPSQSFLEEDEAITKNSSLPTILPLFAIFDKPVFLALCKQLTTITVKKDEHLFRIGDLDDAIYIIQTGTLKVYLNESDNTEITLKEAPSGDSIVSLLSVLDSLTGNNRPFKTVNAKALVDSTLLKLKVDDFKEILEKYPESIVRVTQIIMARLQRITMLESVLTGEPSLLAREENRFGFITREEFLELFKDHPKVVLRLAATVIKRVSGFVRQIDFAIDWIHLEAGRAVYRQGDPSKSLYVLLSGRLRSVVTRTNGKREFVGEYGKGDLVGLVELVTDTERSTTVMAVRDSEIAKLPSPLLDAIKRKYPQILTHLISMLGNRLLGQLRDDVKTGAASPYTALAENNPRPTGSDFATVAVLSNSDEVPLNLFCKELHLALNVIGPVLHLTSDKIIRQLGASVLDKAQEFRLSAWLGHMEDRHKIVLFECDSTLTLWTLRCLRQADCILIVANASQQPTVGAVEKQLEHLSVKTQKELILLHKHDTKRPKDTANWLNIRSWCSSHHHIRCPPRIFIKSKEKIEEVYQELQNTNLPNDSDFARLARFLTGTSIGLVLGGGGARGAAHLGIIKAIREAGIPIDMIGGVSIGAFMGACWAQENDLTRVTQLARNWSSVMTSRWRQILDLTYSATALFTGAAFNTVIKDVFEDNQIEDLWLPYFNMTTDITSSAPRIHRHGSLWRYVRASMTLSGYLPPLCDPVDGHLLVDGGYVNNLPADVMHKTMGAAIIIAVDVGSQDDTDLTNYGDTLNGWWLLWKKWNPFAEPVKVPSLPEIQSRLAYVCCVRQLEEVKLSNYCTYLRPPIDKYRTLDFAAFDQIYDIGYQYGRSVFSSKVVDWKDLTRKDSIQSLY